MFRAKEPGVKIEIRWCPSHQCIEGNEVADEWAKKRLDKTKNRKYRPSEEQKPDPTVARANKRLASRFYQLKMGHCLAGQYLAWTARRPDASCWWCPQYKIQTREHVFKNCPQWKSQQWDPLDDRLGRD